MGRHKLSTSFGATQNVDQAPQRSFLASDGKVENRYLLSVEA
jgi:hypothetical protein